MQCGKGPTGKARQKRGRYGKLIFVWVRGAAIRPVPRYAVLEFDVLDELERELASDSDEARAQLDGAFARFEATQPHVAGLVTSVLARQLDEKALALGYFLAIAIWLGFERRFGDRLTIVSAETLRATEGALDLEEELRAEHAEQPLDLDDVVTLEQPGILTFVHGHVEAALESGGTDAREVDVDDVHLVYRAILVLVLALSQAVLPASGDTARGGGAMLA
jgi:hypothetical protein